jgi:hypothetical protein
MERQLAHGENQQQKGWTKRILNLPGIADAIELVKEHAWVHAVNEALDRRAKGEFGKNAIKVLKKPPNEALSELLSDELVCSYLGNSNDEWLEMLAFKAGPRISELWGLSERAGEYLTWLIYWGEQASALKEADFFTPVLLVNNKDKHTIKNWRSSTEIQKTLKLW